MASAQFDNHWIQSNQSYYKIKTAENGIYRISYDQLLQAGIPVASILPGRLQIFHRGVEQAIFVSSQGDTPLQPGEFIEFYGTRNDGTLDADLYREEGSQPHPFYNLFSDTTAYFLTWDPAGSGKRMELIDLFNSDNLPPLNYHFNQTQLIESSDYSQGRIYPEGNTNAETQLSAFDYGEGWTGPRILKGQVQDFVVASHDNLFDGGVNPTLRMVVAGRNNRPHNFDVLVGPSVTSLRLLKSYTFDFYNNLEIQEELEVTDISPQGQLIVRLSVVGFPDIPADAISLSYLQFSSPQTTDMAGQDQKVFVTPVDPLGTSFIRIANPPPDPRIFDITNPQEPIRIGFTASPTAIEAVIPNTSVERTLLVIGSEYASLLPELVTFQSFNLQANYVIISHSSLMQPDGTSANPVMDYADYRSSPQGGSYQTLVADIEQLYDQFNYGEISPRAIRSFMEFMWSGGEVGYLFLIGKSLTVNHDYHRLGSPAGTDLKDLVPTAGFPGSDIVFTAGLGSTTFEAAVSTGRIIAQTPGDVLAYTDKVKEMEVQDYDQLWRKDLLHLSGGLTISEVNRFLGYVNGYKTISEGDFLGGNVTTKSKEGNSNRELINVSDIVNEGVTLITFYGHSSPNVTDIEIGNVSDPSLGYANKGRYVSILVNGCNSGNIFSTASSFGEDWILTPELGAISYLAHSATGFESNLNQYSQVFYEVGFADSTLNFARIGDVQTETSTRFLDRFPQSETNISQVQQVVLQGDPASLLFGAEKPDFEIRSQDIFLSGFDGGNVTASVDSFQLAMVIQNLGRTTRKPLQIGVQRTVTSGELSQADTMNFSSVLYQDTLYFTMYNEEGSAGVNRFEVRVDVNDSISELNELNNMAEISIAIPFGGSTHLFPQDFGIVGDRTVGLTVQSSDSPNGPRLFQFQLDTTASFNSPFLRSAVEEVMVVGEWEIEVPDLDSTVYYWRSRLQEPFPNEDTAWTQTSFTYIKDGPEGWTQRHFQQIESNRLEGLVMDAPTRQLQFAETVTAVEVVTHGSANPMSAPENIVVAVNGQNLIVSSPSNRLCRDDGLGAIALDKSTTIPYAVLFNSGFDVLDPERCGITPQVINSLRNSDIEGPSQRLKAFIDLVPEGDHVILFSIGEVTYQNWPSDLLSTLEGVGASAGSLATLTNGQPWILQGRKGLAAGGAIEVRADPASGVPAIEQQIRLDGTVVGRNDQGIVSTSVIGPARSWTLFDQNLISVDPQLSDQNALSIIGQDLNGFQTILESDFQGTSLDLSGIDAGSYPLLRLELSTQDQTHLTPGQIAFWQVSFEGVPEGILLADPSDSTSSDAVQEGQTVEAAFQFLNVSNRSFTDSLVVTYRFFNQGSRTSSLDTVKILAPAPGESTRFSVFLETLGMSGTNDLTVTVNPQVEIEQLYSNNTLNLTNFVRVVRDESNPILDVTFDGRYILDGEIVSPNPLILIKLVDDNQVLYKSDTSGVVISLKSPCENCDFETIGFNDPYITWTPASAEANFRVEYQPMALEDGIYSLRVQATDESGNPAGTNPFLIRFEVINESKITHFYPYPNPFSTSTRFVFTLTGAEIPDEIKIQIMTVSGRVVREITQDEIGPLKIGNNITSYAWDGKDEYGDQLANGVYLYRVFVRSQGQELERRETSADQAFKKGFGKLYLLR